MKTIFVALLCVVSTVYGQRADALLFADKVHDFGEIPEAGGKLEFEFTFINNTASAIKVVSVEASCGCTTTGYSKEIIKPGKQGFVKASFDPRGRPGYFNKTISVLTDHSTEPMILQIKGQVKGVTEADPLSVLVAKNGNLRFKHASFSFEKVYLNKEAVEKQFAVLNAGDKPIHFEKRVTSPAYISVDVPELLNAQQRGLIKIRYDAKQMANFGFRADNIEIHTDDEAQPTKTFSVFATCEEYFPRLTDAELVNAPVLLVSVPTLELGRLDTAQVLTRSVVIKNTGKKILTIRALQPNCPCVAAKLDKMILKPLEETLMNVSFNPSGRIGVQNKSITIYSTDPRAPVQIVNIKGYIPTAVQ